MDHSEHLQHVSDAGQAGWYESLARFFSDDGFMPHGHCYLWKAPLVWTHVVSDLCIGVAYLAISLILYLLVKKIKLPFSAVVVSFGVFIGACGATHFMEIWNLWVPNYWLAALIKVITAIASVTTGIWIFRLRPAIVSLAGATQLSEERRAELERTNDELERINLELQESQVLLQERQKALAHTAKMSALGEMAGGIAHEINSPLGIITIHANQLQRFQDRQILTPEIVLKEAELISTTAKRIGEIINGLRAFAREGENDPFESVSVSAIVRNALVLCQTRFKNHSVDLTVSGLDEELMIECRSVQIGQVIINLLNNAFDAVMPLAQKWASLEIKDQGTSILIAVTDSGSGIDPTILPKITQPFFTTKDVGRGTGLGLSISKGIVETHFGSLEVDASSPNTRFVVRLPKRHAKKS